MQQKGSLTLGALDRHEPHVRPSDRLADRRRVGRVVLLAALHVGLHMRRRQKANLVPQRGNLPSPIMRATARLHADKAGRQLAEEAHHLGTAQLPPQRDLAAAVDPVHLKDVLRDIKTDRDNLDHGRLLQMKFQRPHLGTSMP